MEIMTLTCLLLLMLFLNIFLIFTLPIAPYRSDIMYYITLWPVQVLDLGKEVKCLIVENKNNKWMVNLSGEITFIVFALRYLMKEIIHVISSDGLTTCSCIIQLTTHIRYNTWHYPCKSQTNNLICCPFHVQHLIYSVASLWLYVCVWNSSPWCSILVCGFPSPFLESGMFIF